MSGRGARRDQFLPGRAPRGENGGTATSCSPWCPLVSPAVLQAVSRINAAIRRGAPDKTLEALMEPAAQLPAVHPLAAPLYQHQLALLQRQHPRVRVPLPGASCTILGLWDGVKRSGGVVQGLSVSACPAQGELVQEELFVAVEMLSAVALVNRALDAGDPDGLWSSLVSPALGLSDVEDGNAQR